MNETQPECDGVGWLLVSPGSLPDEWQARAIPMALVPLMPHELTARFAPGEMQPASRDDAKLLSLLVQGHTKQRIAREMNISPRTLDRRLRALSDSFGVRSWTELALIAARSGFGGAAAMPQPGDRPSHGRH